MLERGKCSGGRIHSEVVACRQYLVIAGCVFADILVQEVDRALHWERIVDLGGIDHEGRVIVEVDVGFKIFDHFHPHSVVC